MAVVILDRRYRERHQNLLPVFPDAHGFEMVDACASLQGGDDVILFGDAIGWDDERNVAADRLVAGVAEQTLGGRIPALNGSIQRLADDRIVGRFDDRREEPGALQSDGLALFPASSFGYIAKDQ